MRSTCMNSSRCMTTRALNMAWLDASQSSCFQDCATWSTLASFIATLSPRTSSWSKRTRVGSLSPTLVQAASRMKSSTPTFKVGSIEPQILCSESSRIHSKSICGALAASWLSYSLAFLSFPAPMSVNRSSWLSMWSVCQMLVSWVVPRESIFSNNLRMTIRPCQHL